MPRQNLERYHRSIAEELRATKNRVRDLIGADHWLTDGEHKEGILRHVLRTRLPESVAIGRGFVCYPFSNNHLEKNSSGQIDILITSKETPTLYRDGDLVFVTSDAVKSIIEVKTKLDTGDFRETCKKLADKIEQVRNESDNQNCWASLFVYDQGHLNSEAILRIVQEAAGGKKERAINCLSIEDVFILFWDNNENEHAGINPDANEPFWHLYDLRELSPAYFISNLALHLSPNVPARIQEMYFPIPGTKEMRRRYWCSLKQVDVTEFHD